MQCDVLPPSDAHPQLQPFEAIQPPHPFLIHRPALPSQQHPDAQKTEPRAHVRDLANPASQRRLVFRATRPIPRRPTELRQMTGPHAADREGGVHPGGQLAALCGPQTFFRSRPDSLFAMPDGG